MDRKEDMEFFNKRPRNCLISTANSKGEMNVAVYGSPRMIDENTVVLFLECEDVAEARAILAALPLVKVGLIEFDVIPLMPYPGFSRLFSV